MLCFARGCIQGYVCSGLTAATERHIAALSLLYPALVAWGRELEG